MIKISTRRIRAGDRAARMASRQNSYDEVANPAPADLPGSHCQLLTDCQSRDIFDAA